MAVTCEADARRFKAMAVWDGRIVALAAGRDDADDLIGEGTVVVDDPGLTVLPTCDDTHTHLLGAGDAVKDVQVAGARNLGEFLDLIRARAASTPDGQWIVTASNWLELQLAEKRMPTRQELDSAAPDNPVLVKRGGHNDLVNSMGLRLAGVTRDTQAPQGGVIEHDATGEPTGRFEDSALALVEQLLPRRVSTSRSRACGWPPPVTPPPASARSGTRPPRPATSPCCGRRATGMRWRYAPRPW